MEDNRAHFCGAELIHLAGQFDGFRREARQNGLQVTIAEVSPGGSGAITHSRRWRIGFLRRTKRLALAVQIEAELTSRIGISLITYVALANALNQGGIG